VNTTHNYGPGQRVWGHDYAVTQTADGGRQLKVSGWGPLIGPRIREGDYLLLQKDHDRDTRYQVADVRYESDPSDMWHATLNFAPRQAVTKEPR
jgi:hypothetical protein